MAFILGSGRIRLQPPGWPVKKSWCSDGVPKSPREVRLERGRTARAGVRPPISDGRDVAKRSGQQGGAMWKQLLPYATSYDDFISADEEARLEAFISDPNA